MSTIDLELFRRRAEAFIGALDREHYLHFSGQKDELQSAEIYERFADLFTKQTLVALKEHCSSAALDDDERSRCAYLLAFVTESHIGEQTKEISDRLAEVEAGATVDIDGEAVPYRYASVLQANEADRERRRRIHEARTAVLVEQLNPLYDQYWRRAHEVAAGLGYSTYQTLFAQSKAVDHELFAADMRSLMAQTDALYERTLSGTVREQLDLSLDELRIWDMPYLFRAPHYDTHFKGERLLPTLQQTLAGLGIDLASQSNVTVDTEQREKKSPRAFCAPVRVPDEIYLCVMPQGGQDDVAALLHEAGHTEHYAHVSAELPFEYRYLGDNAVTEGFAFLFDHLVHDPYWLQEYLGYADSAEFVQFSTVIDLYFVRRYVGKFLYERQLHDQTGSLDGMGQAYHDQLHSTTLVDFPAEWYLSDVDDGFYVVSYLRAWLLEAALRAMLQGEYGRRWFTDPRAGDLLRTLWGYGQKYTSPRLLLEHGGTRLDAGPLLSFLTATLGR